MTSEIYRVKSSGDATHPCRTPSVIGILPENPSLNEEGINDFNSVQNYFERYL
jgi:hypothetical protein